MAEQIEQLLKVIDTMCKAEPQAPVIEQEDDSFNAFVDPAILVLECKELVTKESVSASIQAWMDMCACVDDDVGFLRLSKNLGQAHGRHRVGGDDIGEHVAGPDRWELVDVSDEQKCGVSGDRRGHGRDQIGVEHRRLVDDEHIELERVVLVSLESTFLDAVLE